MKRILCLFLITAFLLSGCGGVPAVEPGSSETQVPSREAVSGPQQDADRELTQAQKDGIASAVQAVLEKYQNGEYPLEIIYNSDASRFVGAFPKDSEYPKAVAWEDLRVTQYYDPDYMVSMSLTMPLGNDYTMSLVLDPELLVTENGGYIGPERGDPDAVWMVLDASFSDDRGEEVIEEKETANGRFENICYDRIYARADVSGLRLSDRPGVYSGSISYSRFAEYLYLSLNDAEGNAFYLAASFPGERLYLAENDGIMEEGGNQADWSLASECRDLLNELLVVTGLPKEQKDAAVSEIRGALEKYRKGEYPAQVNEGGAFHFFAAFPNDSELPGTIEWEDLSVTNHGYFCGERYSLLASLPLKNDYTMRFVLEPDPADTEGRRLGEVFFSDNRGKARAASMSFEFGDFSGLAYDRLSVAAEFTNLLVRGIDRKNEGTLQYEPMSLVLSVSIRCDSGENLDFRYDFANGKSSAMPDVYQRYTEEELSNVAKEMLALLQTARLTDEMGGAEQESIVNSIRDALQKYQGGEYPLPVIPESEYIWNNPFPAGVSIPQEVDFSELLLLPGEYVGGSGLEAALPLEKGYYMWFTLYPAAYGEDLEWSAHDAYFTLPGGEIIPPPPVN